MDNHRTKHISGDSFSFPSTPSSTDQDYEFEFGSITPDSPYKSSPADHLFFNGRLLPHQFPIPAQPVINYNNAITAGSSAWRSTSRASSKDSLVSSRSNSTNSRSSCSSSSSARTSCSDGSERSSYNKPLYRSSSRRADAAAQVYGSSQRWQFMAAPVLSGESSTSSRRNKKVVNRSQVAACSKEDQRLKKQGKVVGGGERRRFCRRILGWLMLACRECHAMEPERIN